MAPTLYHMALSPPCRAVHMLAKTLGVDITIENVDLMSGDHMKPEYIKINPCHTIPAMTDGSLKLFESRAMLTYLCNKYAADNDQMYPKDADKRALVDCYLLFDMGTFYKAFADYYYPVYFRGAADFDPKGLERIHEVLDILEKFLGNQDFLTGDAPCVADFAIGTSLTTVDIMDFDMSKHPKIAAYYKRFTELPHFEETQKSGVEVFKGFRIQADEGRKAKA